MNQMIRHTWQQADRWDNLTVLICQRKTPDCTKLCIESLERFYPDVKVVVVDGDSQDESSSYLYMKQRTRDNFKVHKWESEVHSHGEMMHHALVHWVNTKYVLLMDSDVIMMRGGLLEELTYTFYIEDTYAAGTVMQVGIKAEGCGPAEDDADSVLYAHPSLSMINREMYFELPPFKNHGAPCIANMIGAKEKGLWIKDAPVQNYSLHLSGSSWTVPRTVWMHDNDVMVRPMVTILMKAGDVVPSYNVPFDYEIVVVSPSEKKWESIITWDLKEYADYSHLLFNIRFNVRGEYVAWDVPTQAQMKALATGDTTGFVRRKEWQKMIVTPDYIPQP